MAFFFFGAPLPPLWRRFPRSYLGIALMGFGFILVLFSLPVPLWLWATVLGGGVCCAGYLIYRGRL